MPEISPDNLTYIREDSDVPPHFLSVLPRDEVYAATIADFVFGQGGTIVTIEYTSPSGTAGNVVAGMTIDFGSSPGAYDLGRGRVKSVDTGSSLIHIGEISIHEVTADIGQYVSIKDEFLIWQKKPRRVETSSDSAEEYNDFDEVYSDQNTHILPIANITANGEKTQPRPAGFVDAGKTYRTIELDASTSEVLAAGASSFTPTWDVGDCTITVGDANSEQITITAPVGFRHIYLTVEDDLGNVSEPRAFPIWTHDRDTYPPLTGFQVTRREWVNGGWTLMVRFIRDVHGIDDESVIPKQTLLCFWEDTTRDQYIGHLLGWTTTESTLLKLYESRLTLTLAGALTWLTLKDGFAQTIHLVEIPSAWYELPLGSTVSDLIVYLLRRYTTFLTVGNLHLPDVDSPYPPDEALPGGSIWAQIVALCQKNQMGEAGLDSLNNLFLTQQYPYRTTADRAATPTMITSEPRDWLHDSGFDETQEYPNKVGYVVGNGSSTDSQGVLTRYASAAPSKVPTDAPGTQTMPFQYLPILTPQTVLNRLVGFHFARVNAKYKPVSSINRGNIDFVEPAWGEKITRSWQHPNLRGLALDGVECLVRRVSVLYQYGQNQKPKQINWTSERATSGLQGFPITLKQNPALAPDPHKAFIDENGNLLLTDNFDMPEVQGGPTYTQVELTLDGDVVQVLMDPFCDGVSTPGDSIDALIVTTEKIYTLEDVWDEHGGRTLTARFTFRKAESLRSLDISRGIPTNAVIVTSYDDGCYRTWSDDLITWETEAQFGSGVAKQSAGDVVVYQDDFTGGVGADTDLLQGSWNGSFGHNANGCITSAFTVFWGCTVRHDLVDAQYLSKASFWMYLDASGGTNTGQISYFDAGFAALGNYSQFVNDSGWTLVEDPAPPSGGNPIKRVVFTSSSSGNTGTNQRLDEIAIYETGTGDPAINQCPGCFVSSIEDGRVYTSGAIDSGADTDGFESDDNGATMSQLTVPDIYPDENLCGDIGVLKAGNFDAETILYHGAIVTGARKTIKVLYLGSSTRDVSPSFGGETFGPWKSRGQVEPHPQDGNIMLVIGTNADKSLAGMWVSSDGGETMTQRIEPVVEGSGRVERAFWVGRGTLQLILLGTSGVIGFSPDAGVTLDNKMGNIGDLTSIGEIVGYVEKYP